jgi:hypothetical protein
MAGLGPAIHTLGATTKEGCRTKCGHDVISAKVPAAGEGDAHRRCRALYAVDVKGRAYPISNPVNPVKT